MSKLVLKLRYNAPDLWSRAKCLDIDVTEDDAFFSDDPVDREEAAEYCNGSVDNRICPVRDKCLFFSLTNNSNFGTWGGMTQESRAYLKKKLPASKGVPNKDWRWMSKEEAMSELSSNTIDEINRSFTDD